MENIKKFLDKLKNKKVVALLCSIGIVLIILINSTYSLLARTDETEVQSYTTGMLEITSTTTNNSVTLTNSLPMEDSAGEALTPYTFTITNTGNLTYTFDVKLLSTTTENQIDAQYIKIKVDDNEITTLSSLTYGKLFENITLAPGESIDVSLRVWLDINTPNSQIGKVFNAKIVTEGGAEYTSNLAKDTLTKLGLTVSEGTPDFSKTSCSSGCDEATVGIYEMEDDYGTSYYFRGDVENNYVKFAGMYWRIIRINGDGSLRIMYDGTSSYANGVYNENRIVGTSVFNINSDDNAYVGYMYGLTDLSEDTQERCLMLGEDIGEDVDVVDMIDYYKGESSVDDYDSKESCEINGGKWTKNAYDATHANVKDSTIKDFLDAWYEDNIIANNYNYAISDTLFCGDRSLYLNSYTGVGSDSTFYGTYGRVVKNTNPQLLCPQKNDTYTVDDIKMGNGDLTYPIGLITGDEVMLAGEVYSAGEIFSYLEKGYPYHFLSPFNHHYIFAVSEVAIFDASDIENDYYGVVPVINLKPEYVQSLVGSGSINAPYRELGDDDIVVSTEDDGGGYNNAE